MKNKKITNILITLALTLFINLPAFAALVDDEHARILGTSNQLVEADNKLNEAYKALKTVLKKDEIKKLTAGQRSWLQYRNSACFYGSSFNYVDVECGLTLTQERTTFLTTTLQACKAGQCSKNLNDFKKIAVDHNKSRTFLVNPKEFEKKEICHFPEQSFNKGFCLLKASVEIDKQIEKMNNELFRIVNQDQKNKLIASQQVWKQSIADSVTSDNTVSIGDDYQLKTVLLAFLTERLQECQTGNCNDADLVIANESDVFKQYKKEWGSKE